MKKTRLQRLRQVERMGGRLNTLFLKLKKDVATLQEHCDFIEGCYICRGIPCLYLDHCFEAQCWVNFLETLAQHEDFDRTTKSIAFYRKHLQKWLPIVKKIVEIER